MLMPVINWLLADAYYRITNCVMSAPSRIIHTVRCKLNLIMAQPTGNEFFEVLHVLLVGSCKWQLRIGQYVSFCMRYSMPTTRLAHLNTMIHSCVKIANINYCRPVPCSCLKCKQTYQLPKQYNILVEGSHILEHITSSYKTFSQ